MREILNIGYKDGEIDAELALRIGRSAVRAFPSSVVRKIPVCVRGEVELADLVRRGVLLGSGRLSPHAEVEIEVNKNAVIISVDGAGARRRIETIKTLILSENGWVFDNA